MPNATVSDSEGAASPPVLVVAVVPEEVDRAVALLYLLREFPTLEARPATPTTRRAWTTTCWCAGVKFRPCPLGRHPLRVERHPRRRKKTAPTTGCAVCGRPW